MHRVQAVNLTAQTNAEEINRQLSVYLARARARRREALRRVGARVVRKLLRFTPPRTKRQGEKAVRRDLSRAVALLTPGTFTDRRIQLAIRARDYVAMQAIFANIKKGPLKGAQVLPFKPELHQEARDARGRVRSPTGIFTLDRVQWRTYLKRVLDRVGLAKGSWAESALALHEDVLPWAERHRKAGKYREQSAAGGPVLEMISNTEWAVSERERIEREALDQTLAELTGEVKKREDEALADAFASGKSLGAGLISRLFS